MATLDAGFASLEIAKAVAVPMGFGTDLLGETRSQQSREFSIRAQVLSPAEIPRSDTVVNAEILNRSEELAVISAGALADLLVVDGDPLESLSLLEEQGKRLTVIMKGGQLFVNRPSRILRSIRAGRVRGRVGAGSGLMQAHDSHPLPFPPSDTAVPPGNLRPQPTSAPDRLDGDRTAPASI